MVLKLRLDVQAWDDLSAIREHLKAEASAVAADRVRAHLRKRMESLRHNPRLGVRSSDPEIRILPPTRYPYRIYYTITDEAVVILHIRHSARRDPDLSDFSN